MEATKLQKIPTLVVRIGLPHTHYIYTTLFHHRTSLSVKIWFLANSVCCDGVDIDLILYSVSVCLSVCLSACLVVLV